LGVKYQTMHSIYSEKRNSGIPSIGDLPWGSHFCQFYQTKQDLLDLLVPYFKAGLEKNELCVWVTSRPLRVEDAKNALREAVPGFEGYASKGQVEIIPYTRWRTRDGDSDAAIVSRLDRAISSGFDGLRLSCSAFPEKKGGKNYTCYGVDVVGRYNVIALYAYPRDKFDAVGLMEVVKNHRFALVRNAGSWEVIESSEARVVKDALKRSEEKLRSLFNNMSEGFAYHRIVLDTHGKPCDYVFLEVNDAFERLTGLKNVIGKKVSEVLPGIEKDPAGWIEKYGGVALTGKPMHFESYSKALGKWYSISVFSPHKGYFAVTFDDITEKKKAENELLRAKAEWERTFDSVPDLIAILDERHRIVRLNRAMAERLGHTPEECAGLCCHAAVHGMDAPPELCPHARTLADGQEHTTEVYEKRLGGHFLVSTTPICSEQGKMIGSVHVARDITGQKKSEEALKKAHEELQKHAEKLETANKELEDFSYSVSHDLRSPLRAIAGFTRMILDENGAAFNPETRRKFGVIQDNAQKMGRLIDDLLRLSRLGRAGMSRSKLDMGSLMAEVVAEIQVAESDREFVVEIGDLPATEGDRAMIRQLLVNLLSNAVKFTRGKEGARIEAGSFERSGEQIYYVKDNGVGFDMKYYNKLFGVFQRLVSESQFEGTGVGLAIVERIVQRHGGRVWAEGKIQEGATFYFTLPKEQG